MFLYGVYLHLCCKASSQRMYLVAKLQLGGLITAKQKRKKSFKNLEECVCRTWMPPPPPPTPTDCSSTHGTHEL